ncbi:TonB-dependent siderophore receptor [Veronia nyctiphanis]|uniref:TonB-dependent siderophore receptor n=1 Tax=Veronia nyctiphanis TaxID=1278244 RepID=A0A4Q0YRY6_9GAMM|nr:TonB-dependent siderophore receptor [Veronia nyctiphanis]RXJ73922.1 TonB-dependent siderophore receptor [Veronia nyctiphanis]
MRRITFLQQATLSLGIVVSQATPVFSDEYGEYDEFGEYTSLDESVFDTVTVFGKSYRNTATKTSLKPEETPQGITVIDGETLTQQGVKSLNQALRYVPGMVTETKGAAVTMYDNFYARGFQIRQAYYDGLQLPYLIGWNLQPQIDPIAIQQIEIFKGPTSVLYGAMPPGGMVNIIGKAPQPDQLSVLSLSMGSRNLMEASIDSSGPVEFTDLTYRIIALGRKQNSQVDNAKEERFLIAPSLNWQVSDSTELSINLYYQSDPSMGVNSSLPASGMFIDNPLGSVTPSTSAGDLHWSQFERKIMMAGYKINHEFSDDWSFLQNARYVQGELAQKNTYHTCAEPDNPANCFFNYTTGSLLRNLYSTDEESTGFTVDNQFSGEFSLGPIDNNLLFGIDFQYLSGKADYKEFITLNLPFYTFNIFNPNNDVLEDKLMFDLYSRSEEITGKQYGVYIQDQIRAGDLVLLAGGRYDIYEGNLERDLNVALSPPTQETIETKQDAFSYRVGALYELGLGIAPYVSYATGFEPTEGSDVDGKEFVPETSEQWEAGVKIQSDDEKSGASVSAYHITKSNAMVTDPTDFRNKRLQVGEIVSQGVEFQTRWALTDSFTFGASYTLSDMKVTKDSDVQLEGTTPIYVPEHAGNIWSTYYIDWGLLSGTRISGGARYVGEMQMDVRNTQGKVPAYTIVDLSLGYDLGEFSDHLSGATANVAVTNALDEESYTCYDKTNCWFGAERSFEVKVDYESEESMKKALRDCQRYPCRSNEVMIQTHWQWQTENVNVSTC